MTCREMNMKECSFEQKRKQKFFEFFASAEGDAAVLYNEKNLPSWNGFKNGPITDAADFLCISCVDDADKERLSCFLIDNRVVFSSYGDYIDKARIVIEQIEKIFVKLQ